MYVFKRTLYKSLPYKTEKTTTKVLKNIYRHFATSFTPNET